MEFTGERVIPGQTDPDLLNEHLARYAFAEALVRSKRVLDAGCGVPYGSLRLAKQAAAVFALDSAREPLAEARGEYASPKVHAVQGDCTRLPFVSGAMDAVVAFEVIEHLKDWPALLEEVRRVLAPAGVFLVSTPNRLYYAESRDTPNEFHVHEFDYEEFQAELRKVFPHTTIFLENHTHAITFAPPDIQGVRTSLDRTSAKPDEAHFFLAVCSSEPLFGSPAFVFVPESGNVLREREHHIELLEGELEQKSQWLEETTSNLKALTEEHVREQAKAQAAIDKLEEENESKTRWAHELEGRLEERTQWSLKLEAENTEVRENYRKLDEYAQKTAAELQKCVELLDEAEKRVIERSEWAMRLDRELEAARAELAALYGSLAYRVGRRLNLAPQPPGATPNARSDSPKS
jgi:SAM-dependent methyltransferase